MPVLENKTILITGFGGFVATHLFCHLFKRHPKNIYILLAHNFTPQYWDIVVEKIHKLEPLFGNPNVHLLIGDITNNTFLRSIFSKYNIDIVIHLAAQSIVQRSEQTPRYAAATNIIGTINILELVKKANCSLIYQSTDKVYGDVENATLETPIKPVDFYGITKASADLMVQFYQRNSASNNIIIVRPCNLFGYDNNHGRLIPDIILTCIRNENPRIQLYPDNTFPKRQFLFIQDYSRIIEQLLIDLPIKSELFSIKNIASPFVFTTKEVAEIIINSPPFYGNLKLEYKKSIIKSEITHQSLKLNEPYIDDFTEFNPSILDTIRYYQKFN